MKHKAEGVRKLWERYKYAAVILLIGVALLLWPSGSEKRQSSGGEEASSLLMPQTREMEEEIAQILSTINGVGQTRVMLTVETDGERQLAQNREVSYTGDVKNPDTYSSRLEPIVTDGDSGEEMVVTQNQFPVYRGALVVCQGADRADVRLTVTEAVATLTGLSSDRVVVAKWQ